MGTQSGHAREVPTPFCHSRLVDISKFEDEFFSFEGKGIVMPRFETRKGGKKKVEGYLVFWVLSLKREREREREKIKVGKGLFLEATHPYFFPFFGPSFLYASPLPFFLLLLSI